MTHSQREISGRMVFIEEIVANFEVTIANEALPFPWFLVRVTRSKEGEMIAWLNVQVRNSKTRCIEYVCGTGQTIESAVICAIEMFLKEVDRQAQNGPLDESMFAWQQPNGYFEPSEF